MFNKIIFVFLAICAFQGLTNAQTFEVKKFQEKGISEDVAAAIAKIKILIEQAVATATAQFDQMLASLVEYSQRIIDEFTKNAENEIASILHKIEQLKESAEALGLDISVCVGNSEEDLKQIPSRILEELVECLTSKIREAESIVSEAINDISSTIDIVTSLTEELHTCGSGIVAIPCQTKVLAKAMLHVAELPAELAFLTAQATQLIANLKTDLIKCAVIKVAQVTIESGEILIDITKCIQNQVQNSKISIDLIK